MTDSSNIPNNKEIELYRTVANRRCNYDSMLWQTPAISLTAQAFLLTIALGPESTNIARCISSALAFITALASSHLLSKHRHFERCDSEWLIKYEEKFYSSVTIHGKDRHYEGKKSLFYSYSAYKCWRNTLLTFAVVSLVIFVIAIRWPDLLGNSVG